MSKYFWNILIAIDQLFNTILAGDPDETISSRLGKWAYKSKQADSWKKIIAKTICRLLNIFDKNHCKDSIENDEGQDSLI